jgi:Protein of unknown function (DUF1566)
MTRWLALGVVAAACLVADQRPVLAQSGPYYPLPAWDQKFPTNIRFVLVLFEETCVNNICAQIAQGVLDRETGVVWERSPSSSDADFRSALLACGTRVHSNRLGWRLPSLDELTSLFDPTITTPPRLPSGHPFLNVVGSYWTSTEDADPNLHFVVSFSDPGFVVTGAPQEEKQSWCVRGGSK